MNLSRIYHANPREISIQMKRGGSSSSLTFGFLNLSPSIRRKILRTRLVTRRDLDSHFRRSPGPQHRDRLRRFDHCHRLRQRRE